METPSPFAVLSKKYDDYPHIVAQMECCYADSLTVKELRERVGADVRDPITNELGKIVSFNGPCMADDCERPRDPDPRFGNHCCRPIYVVQYSGKQKILHLDEIRLIENEQMSSLPW